MRFMEFENVVHEFWFNGNVWKAAKYWERYDPSWKFQSSGALWVRKNAAKSQLKRPRSTWGMSRVGQVGLGFESWPLSCVCYQAEPRAEPNLLGAPFSSLELTMRERRGVVEISRAKCSNTIWCENLPERAFVTQTSCALWRMLKCTFMDNKW